MRSDSAHRIATATSTRFTALAVSLILAACNVPQADSTKTSATASQSDKRLPRLAPGAAIAYDPGSRLVLLFGITEGDFKAATWTWDGRSWTEQRPRSSPGDLRGSLAYDWGSSALILFGTTYPGLESQTWAWKGGNWVQLHPVAEPTCDYSFSLASDAPSKRVLAFGGCCAQDVLLSETWSYLDLDRLELGAEGLRR